MESYIERKRKYREIMRETIAECREKIEKTKEDINQQPYNLQFQEDQAKLGEQFQAVAINQQVNSIVSILKERKFIDNGDSIDILHMAQRNLSDKYVSSSTYLIVKILLHIECIKFNECIKTMAENNFDFNPGPLFKWHQAELLKDGIANPDEGLIEGLYDIRPLVASRYIRYYKPYPIINIIVHTKQILVMNAFKCLINNGLTDFGLSPYSDYVDFIFRYVRNVRFYKMIANPSTLMGIFFIMFELGLQHGNGMKHYKYKSDLNRFPPDKLSSVERQFMQTTIDYVEERRKQPMSLSALSRLTIRRRIGGLHFNAKIEQLPLPYKMKKYVIGTVTCKNGPPTLGAEALSNSNVII